MLPYASISRTFNPTFSMKYLCNLLTVSLNSSLPLSIKIPGGLWAEIGAYLPLVL